MTRRSPSTTRQSGAQRFPELERLGDLPPDFTYFDDFTGKTRTLERPEALDTWELRVNETTFSFDFTPFTGLARALLKRWALWALSSSATISVHRAHWGNRRLLEVLGPEVFLAPLHAHPMDLREMWHTEVTPGRTQHETRGLKSLLHFCCEKSLGHLTPAHADFVSSLRLPSTDKYRAVRMGAVFLTFGEEGQLVDFLDELNARVRGDPGSVPMGELRAGSILLISYQHAFRPLQIAKLRRQDVRIISRDREGPALRATFETVKQRWSSAPRSLGRSFKREWSFALAAFLDYRDANPREFAGDGTHMVARDSCFGLSPGGVSSLIRRTTEAILGHTRSANELRHTAAQRMADAGATKDELAEFLGHASLETGLIYFDSSPTQASRLNKALALSPIYSGIVEVARTGVIDKNALLGLDADQQVAGCPHGFPIAGIGACHLGQSLCTKNPVLACYGCQKFLPVADADLHRDVLTSLRSVVRFYFDASRGEDQSAAYSQLTRTLSAVEQVIAVVERS
jgi:integrase